MQNHARVGFTLLELSIVLVIIGLVIGGVLVGRDMIRGAELRRIARSSDEVVVAIQTFRVKYGCLPGDCPTATDFFGMYDQGANGGDGCGEPEPQGRAVGNATCDGDGDGMIDGGTDFAESLQAWQQMGSAGLLAGQFSGSTPDGYLFSARPGLDCPTIPGGENFCWLWTGRESSLVQGSATWVNNGSMPGWIRKTILMASRPGGIALGYPKEPQLMSPTDAAAFDSKYDDGNATTGRILVGYYDRVLLHCATNAGVYNAKVAAYANRPVCAPFFHFDP